MSDKQTPLQKMNEARDTASSFFENLYRQFILRDFFAKIAPGFLAIFSTSVFLLGSLDEALNRLNTFSFGQWLLLISICWIAGFTLQHGGILIRYLDDPVYLLFKSKKEADQKMLHDHYADNVSIVIKAPDEFTKVRERARVIKEACGNFSMAILYATSLLLGQYLIGLFSGHRVILDERFIRGSVVVVFLLISARVLWRSHQYNSMRDQLYGEEYIRMIKARKALQKESDKCQLTEKG